MATRAMNRVYVDPSVDQGDVVNTNLNALEFTVAEKEAIEDALSFAGDNITARVTVGLGDDPDYVKVKWQLNNKPLCLYKSRDFDQDDAADFIEEVRVEFLGLPATT